MAVYLIGYSLRTMRALTFVTLGTESDVAINRHNKTLVSPNVDLPET